MLLKLNEETKSLFIALDDLEATTVVTALGYYEDSIDNDYMYLKKHIHEMASAIFMKSLELKQIVNESEEFYADTQ